MVFVTGDKHANFSSPDDYRKVEEFCKKFHTSKNDYMIVLGDHGVQYFGDWRDDANKERLAAIPITFIMIRGNHDRRVVAGKRFYLDTSSVKGWFIKDVDYPDILYTEEFGWYVFGDERVFVINGAYSIDKNYRLEMHFNGIKDFKWFPDEQLNESERNEAQTLLLHEMYYGPFSIMSHTCPIQHRPFGYVEGADDTMEKWMGELYYQITKECPDNLDCWYCGHWHVDQVAHPVRFMYHDILNIGGFQHESV